MIKIVTTDGRIETRAGYKWEITEGGDLNVLDSNNYKMMTYARGTWVSVTRLPR